MLASPDIFRPPTSKNLRSKKMREWIESSASNRLDMLQSNPGVTGLMCYNDGLFTTLDGLRIIKSGRPSLSGSPRKKDIVGAVGKPTFFQLFSMSAGEATSNFYSYLPICKDGYIPFETEFGPYLMDELGKVRATDRSKIRKMFTVDIEKERLGIIYLPLVLPLSTTDFVPEGGLEDTATLEAIAKIHPLAKCWAEAMVNDRLLVASKANHLSLFSSGLLPSYKHLMTAQASPETAMQLLRSGPLKADFGAWAEGVLATNIKARVQTSQASSQATSKASGKGGPSKLIKRTYQKQMPQPSFLQLSILMGMVLEQISLRSLMIHHLHSMERLVNLLLPSSYCLLSPSWTPQGLSFN